jgi:SAM-dependent methyltransferase
MAASDIIDYLEIKGSSLGIPNGAKILDFGCGNGELVLKFRELGFDAHGVDIRTIWKAECNDVCNVFLPGYQIPFKDAEFDLVVSTSVMEHVMNKEEAFLEIKRILKPGAYAAHVFPSKFYMPLEPHIKVPFANLLDPQASKFYLTMCALVGFRNSHQKSFSWRQVRDANLDYMRDGLNYWSRRRYKKCAEEIYSESTFDDVYASCGAGLVAQVDKKIKSKHARTIWRKFASFFRNQLLLCKK